MKTLFLDVMDTIVYDPFAVELPAFFDTSLDDLLRVKHPSAWVDFECGKMSELEFANAFFLDGRPVDHEGLKACMVQAYEFLPGMIELLQDLQELEVSMHTLSNYPVWYEWIESKLELSRLVEWTFVSCNFGVRKPDPRAFQNAASAVGRPLSECVFVDDRRKNCEAARAAGMASVQFMSAKQLREELVTWYPELG